MRSFVEVAPASELRQDFASWTNRNGYARTVSPNSFAVPPAMFPEIPEELLLGAVIDGQPYQPKE